MFGLFVYRLGIFFFYCRKNGMKIKICWFCLLLRKLYNFVVYVGVKIWVFLLEESFGYIII